ncbi:MAG: PepSY domain-containing protein [Pyrinomonadaceae bacterium]|nr:PepSY domain-containing protein [Acidobacteriota bacterium]MBK7933031.1 PepSY domain-containing protein [Acidobacteriota bacterium]MBP7375480.1 PepSY domain-containing protein [Pyrinomonadaceae bacterium]
MKTMFRIFLLVVFLIGSTSAVLNARTSEDLSNDRDLHNDNKRKKRGGRDDDSNAANSNSTENSNSNGNSRRSSGSITIEQARNVAVKAVPGEILKEEFENERGRSVYEFYIRKSSGDVYEVYIDAGSAKVIKVELDD